MLTPSKLQSFQTKYSLNMLIEGYILNHLEDICNMRILFTFILLNVVYFTRMCRQPTFHQSNAMQINSYYISVYDLTMWMFERKKMSAA